MNLGTTESATIRRFRLSESFIDQYKEKEVPWGPLGYVTFKRTYARRLNEFDPDATGSEEWWQTCRRVVEGMFNMQKQHVFMLGLEWNDNKAQRTAKDTYSRDRTVVYSVQSHECHFCSITIAWYPFRLIRGYQKCILRYTHGI